MKSSNTNIKVGDSFHYWKVIEIINPSTAKCLCTGCNKVEREIWFCKLLKGSIKSCGCKTNELRKQRALEKYGVENISQAKEIKQRKVQTTLTNFGVAFPMQSKEVQNKSKQTVLEKFGVEHISQEPSIKARKTKSFVLQDPSIKKSTEEKLLKLYGSNNYLKVEGNRELIKEKIKETYGVDNPSQSPEVKQRKKQTSLKRYGTEHPQQSKELRSKKLEDNEQSVILSDGRYLTFACDQVGIINKSHAYNLFRFFGEDAVLHYINNYNNHSTTDLEDRFIELLKPYFQTIEKYNRKPIEGSLNYRPDFRLELNGKVLYVNVDGLYYHSELMIEDKLYHFKMREAFEREGLRLMQFRADELWSKGEIVKSIILNYFGVHRKIAARSCTLMSLEKSKADLFFKENHLMGTHSAFKSWGLMNGEELICTIAIREFSSHIEICRFGSKLNTSVQGGFSKLLKHVGEVYKKKKVISFCDLRYSNGVSYHKLGFKLDSSALSFQWTNLKEVFSRYYCRASMDNRALSEREYAKLLRIYKIYDAGQSKFIL